ncbi:MAG TPA: lytic transglycosylase [Desulfovibrio sp.]|uniref:Transglycosylase, SLT family n=3 Tax=Nitratidesulfovibrio vulgaris TaxID=881 RepID=Q72BU8_NITV2|nr:transglycosylase, SLT family [Nitratidesulfovibrio vulgaris str. Hildenborough]ABM28612.1 Lytic transglycosylase, catalytic [Nitratidesulfovibrio vulgaris DP4]HBW16780.1 lytic transglycosylase [Desulfovibrio sp.]
MHMNIRHRKACVRASLVTSAVAAVLGLVMGFVPEQGTNSVRRSLDRSVLRVAADAAPVPVPHDSDTGWQWRGEVDSSAGANTTRRDVRPMAGDGLVRFENGGVLVATVDGGRVLSPAMSQGSLNDVSPVLGMDGSRLSPLLAVAVPEQYGEPLDVAGRPVRWLVSAEEYASRLGRECRQPRSPSIGGVMRINRRAFAGGGDVSGLAGVYKAQVERFARKFGVRSRLVYAIMHAESGFDPAALSHASAHGLMQVVPGTAGEEVSAFLARRGESPADVDLFDPEDNIRYGIAYLHLLLNRHFADIRQPNSRELCAIAAYNGGPTRVLRVFGADRAQAVDAINALRPQQVYERLIRFLPAAESRAYVDKVLASLESFSDVR